MDEITILGPAFVAGLVVLATHVPLGVEVINRGIIFIDLAIAQIAGAGVILASLLGWEDNIWAIQASAVAAAVAGGLLFTWSEKKMGKYQEPLIGIFFVLAATGSVLMLAGDPHGGEALKEILVGQILWVEYQQLLIIAAIYSVLLLVWVLSRERIGSVGFYLVFAISITLSVQIVGVYLVFASLIVPALATVQLAGRGRLLVAYTMAASAYLLGLYGSLVLDLPAAALIVWCLGLLGSVVGVAAFLRANSAN